MKRITVIAGHFGSGKTEFAVNYAMHLRKTYENVVIADMDTVNPYFRTKDAESELEDAGVRVISPEFANTNLDIISIPGEINSVFEDDTARAVFDVGGDDEGAVVLGMFRKQLEKCGYDMFLVVNKNRPFTDTAEHTVEMIRAIETASGLKFTGIVSNTNLLDETTPDIVRGGEEMCEAVSERTGIPLVFVASDGENSGLIKNRNKFFKLDFYIKRPF